MPINAQDIEAFIQQLDANPELKRALQDRLVDAEAVQRALSDPTKRDAIRRVVLGDDWEDMPTLLRQLIESQQRHEAILQEHTHILQEHTQQLAMLIQTQQRHEAILQEHTRILQEHTQQLAMLIQTQQRHEAILQEHTRILQEHTRILQEHTQQLAMLIQTQQRHEAILQEHTEILRQHTQMLIHLNERYQHLESAVEGLKGLQMGEAHERETLRRAVTIFRGGSGGSPDHPQVQRRLRQWLRPFYKSERPMNPQADPFLADVIWWKDSKVIVGEISIKVDRLDVQRAKQRAQTLRQLGVDATPVVIGLEWSQPETMLEAQEEAVEWFVDGKLSDGFIEFRKLEEPLEADEEV
jgi:hypothetical protein